MIMKRLCALLLVLLMILSMSVTAFGDPHGGKHPPPTIPPGTFSLFIPCAFEAFGDPTGGQNPPPTTPRAGR